MANEENSRALNAQIMFDNLKKYIGKQVKCVYWEQGKKKETVEILSGVRDFMRIDCIGVGIPFIGNRIAICEIISKNGEVLYSNPYIEEGYNRIDEIDIQEARNKSFGNYRQQKNNPYRDWPIDPAFYYESDLEQDETKRHK